MLRPTPVLLALLMLACEPADSAWLGQDCRMPPVCSTSRATSRPRRSLYA